MATPFIAGLAVAGVAMGARGGLALVQKIKANPDALRQATAAAAGVKGMGSVFKKLPGMGSFMPGFAGLKGFEATMTRGEASKVLGLKTSSPNKDQVKQAHRKIMMLNHPDRGGSPYIASKINEASETLQGSRRSSGSAFS